MQTFLDAFPIAKLKIMAAWRSRPACRPTPSSLGRGIAEALRLNDQRIAVVRDVFNPDMPEPAFQRPINPTGPYAGA